MSIEERALVVQRGTSPLAQLLGALRPQLPCDGASSDEEAVGRLKKASYAVVVLEHRPPLVDALPLLRATLDKQPEALVVVMTAALDPARELEALAPGRVFGFVGGVDRRWELGGFVAQGLRLARMEREQRDLVRKLGSEYSKLQRREKLLDEVVRERTRELRTALSQLKAANRQLLLGLAEVIEAKDAYTKGHCGRVAGFALSLAELSSYPEAEMEHLEYASFLHDVGKIAVRDSVLQKPGPLAADEWSHMQIHPVVGDGIASQIDLLRPLRPAIRNHHERWDGTGYPDRLVGERIPIEARIVCIADAWDAMATDRPYKNAIPIKECYGFLRKGRGSQFDPTLVDLFVENRLGDA